jgi:hypothetical protein
MAVSAMGWGRCRMCGHESLRDPQPYDRYESAYVAASLQHGESLARKRAAGAPALGLSLYSISDK